MREITLTQGFVALVDDEDYERIAAFKWCAMKRRNTFHAMRKENRTKTIYMHHYILGNSLPGIVVDHIDRNGLNNQRSNLRFTSYAGNARNSDRSDCAERVEKHGNRYRARMRVEGKRITVGTYDTWAEAYRAASEFLQKNV
jgi:hypothetical protein